VVIDKHGRSGIVRRLGTGLTIAIAGSALLAGCAVGQHAATVQKVPMVDGVSADQGPIGIRAAGIAPPESNNYQAGKDAPLQMVIVNNGTKDDQLTEVSTPAAKSVLLSPSGARSAASSSEPSPSSSGSEPPLTSQSSPIPIPAGSSVKIGYSAADPSVILTGLTTDLYPGQSIPMSFTFASGAVITTHLAVKLTTGENSAPTIPIAPSEGQ
jgi:copper(I)-binding protein